MVNAGADIAIGVGGGAAGLTLLVWMVRKAWAQVVGAKTDTHAAVADQSKIAADAAIFMNMQSEMKRMADELREIKAAHKAERQELEHRIDELEARLSRLSFRLGHIRRLAVDAYAELTSRECVSCLAIDRAVIHIKKILEEE